MTAERRGWFKLASHLGLPLQEVMEATTSTEFVEWMMLLREEEWEVNTKTHYYLAQIAAEVRQFREGFMKKPKAVSIQDCLIPREGGKTTDDPEKCLSVQSLFDSAEPPDLGVEVVEISPDLVDDPKWSRVNQNAKSMWASLLGGTADGGTPPA